MAKRIALSTQLKKLSADFAMQGGTLQLPKAKWVSWQKTIAALPDAERAKTAQELLSLAVRFQREGGVAAANGCAQLYVLAASLLTAAGKEAKAAGPGWGSSKKR